MRTPKKKIFTLLLIVSLFAIPVIHSKTVSSSVRAGLIDGAAAPLKAARSVSSFARRLIPFASLREENKMLREKVNLIARKLEETRGLSEENERLKDLINFRKNIPYPTIPAQVIGRDPTNWSGSLIIDKGLDNGVGRNKAVIASKGLVGRTLEIGKYSSRILLITDPNSRVGVVIQRNRQGGILVGRPDGKCKMIYIALDSDVAPGDKVMTAGLGGIFPKDVLAGEVVRVDKEPGRLYKYAIVKTAAELSKLEEVLCVK